MKNPNRQRDRAAAVRRCAGRQECRRSHRSGWRHTVTRGCFRTLAEWLLLLTALSALSTERSAWAQGPLTVFNNSDSSGLWNDAANWSAGIPSSAIGSQAYVNGGLTATIQAGDTLTATQLWVGRDGSNGTVNQPGGALTVQDQVGGGQTGWIVLGGDGGGIGTYNLSGGSLTFSGSDNLYVGENAGGTGFLNISNNASLTSNNLAVGRWYGGLGTVTQGDTSTVNITGVLRLGASQENGTAGTGTYIQNGGTATIGQVVVGDGTSGVGSYNLNGGTLTTNYVTVGNQSGSAGTLTQSGGSITVNGDSTIGGAGAGSLALNAGTYTTAGIAYVGLNGAGTLNIANGNFVVNVSGTANGLLVGNGATGYGVVNQTGGSITTPNGGWSEIGNGTLGGQYNLSAGSFTDPVSRIEVRNFGSLNVSGTGSLVSTSQATAGTGADPYALTTYSGNVNISGGTVTSNGIFLVGYNLGHNDSLAVNQTGGLVAVNGARLDIGDAGSTGVYNLAGGKLSAYQIGSGSGQGAFSFNGGILQANISNNDFIQNNLAAVTINNGGATIDSNGFNSSINHPLDSYQAVNTATGGQSLTSIALSGGETLSGYAIGSTPSVLITGGGGHGASAVAVIDGSGDVVGFNITNPGVGYTSEPTIQVGGAGVAPITLNSADGQLNSYSSNAGLTVIDSSGTNSGVIQLNAVNSYPGPTIVDGGTLQLNAGGSQGTLAAGNLVTVNSGATLLVGGQDALGYTIPILGATGGTGLITVNEGGTLNIAAAIHANITGGLNLNGGTLTSDGPGNLTNGGNWAIEGPVTATSAADGTASLINATSINLANQQWFGTANVFIVNAGGGAIDLLVNSPLIDGGGGSGFIKNGNGVMVLASTNNYSGTTTINGGTLQIGDGGSTGTLGSGPVVDNANLSFNLASPTVYAPPTAISGTGTLTQNGTGTTILNTSESYSGGTTVNAGTLQLNVGGPTGTLAPGSTAIVNNGGTLLVGTTDALGYTIPVLGTTGGTGLITLNEGSALSIVPGIHTNITGGLNLVGGTVTAQGAGDSYANYGIDSTVTATSAPDGTPSTINAPVVALATNQWFGSNNVFNVNPGGGPIDLLVSSQLINSGGPSSLDKNGNGVMVLANSNNAYSGTTTINGGTLQIGSGGTTGSLGTGPVVDNANLAFNLVSPTVYAPPTAISGTGTLTQNGTGSTILNTNESYSGGTTVNAGTLQLNVGGSTGTLAPGSTAIVNNGGTLLVGTTDALGYTIPVLGTTGGTGLITLNEGGALSIVPGIHTNITGGLNLVGGTVTAQGAGDSYANYGIDSTVTATSAPDGTPSTINAPVVALATNQWFGSNNVFNVNPGGGPIDLLVSSQLINSGGPSSLDKNGNGVMVLANSNNAYSGTTTINGGALQIGNGGTTGSLGTGPVVDNANLSFNLASPVSYTVNNPISGSGNLIQAGSGTTVLPNAESYGGNTTVSAGLLSVTGSIANNGSANVFVQSGGSTFGGAGSATGGEIDRSVAASAPYAGYGSQDYGAGTNHTAADINAGQAVNGAGAVDMSWRNIASNEVFGSAASPPFSLVNGQAGLVSDVLNLDGMSTVDGPGTATDPFAMTLSYNASLLLAGHGSESQQIANGDIRLEWLNPGTGTWQTAAAGDNATGALASTTFQGTFNQFAAAEDALLGPNYVQTHLVQFLGSWGADAATHTAWAIVDHNSAFAVAVPEPSSWVLGAAGFCTGLGFCFRRRRSNLPTASEVLVC